MILDVQTLPSCGPAIVGFTVKQFIMLNIEQDPAFMVQNLSIYEISALPCIA